MGQEELELLHAEAVLSGTAGDDNVWFKAIDARSDKLTIVNYCILTVFTE